jgi:predicted DNA-binding transcriptional regulator AlpA
MKAELLTTEEVAAILRVKKNTIEKWRQRPGHGPRFLKFGSDGASGRVRYTEEAIDEYVAAAEAKAGA